MKTKNNITTYQNLWDAANMLRGKFIAANAHVKKQDIKSITCLP